MLPIGIFDLGQKIVSPIGLLQVQRNRGQCGGDPDLLLALLFFYHIYFVSQPGPCQYTGIEATLL